MKLFSVSEQSNMKQSVFVWEKETETFNYEAESESAHYNKLLLILNR